MAKYSKDLLIISNRHISDEYFVIKLQAGQEVESILPGQFVQVRVDNANSTFLRRPISVYDIDIKDHTIDLLIKVVGEGTELLSKQKSGERLGIIYPLGNSFSLPRKGQRVLLVGGGVGVAPLFMAGKWLNNNGIDIEFLLGYRSAGQLIDTDSFSSLGKLSITTEDGSYGEKGLVINHSRLKKENFDRIYCCGPDPMMKAVARLASGWKIHCEVSLENLMACGIGVCLCCIEPTVNGNLCACTDGPVFNIKDLKWQI